MFIYLIAPKLGEDTWECGRGSQVGSQVVNNKIML